MFRRSFLGALATVLLASTAYTQDAELYAAPPPPDAAFVRFFGFEEGTEVTWQGLTFSGADTALENFFVVHSGDVAANPGDLISVIANGSTDPIVVVAPKIASGKVSIALVNLMDAPVSLYTADKKVEIIADTAPLSIGWREVNPIQVEVGVLKNGELIGEGVSLALRRSEVHSVVVSADGAVRDVRSEFLDGIVE